MDVAAARAAPTAPTAAGGAAVTRAPRGPARGVAGMLTVRRVCSRGGPSSGPAAPENAGAVAD
eukprot:scaffold1390_cov234-Prasinococcus_capsulatus_cf.AAC.3